MIKYAVYSLIEADVLVSDGCGGYEEKEGSLIMTLNSKHDSYELAVEYLMKNHRHIVYDCLISPIFVDPDRYDGNL